MKKKQKKEIHRSIFICKSEILIINTLSDPDLGSVSSPDPPEYSVLKSYQDSLQPPDPGSAATASGLVD